MLGFKKVISFPSIKENVLHELLILPSVGGNVLKELISLPFVGGDVVLGLLTSLSAILPKSENIPSLKESIVGAESPMDLLIDYVNFWARFTGIEMIKIDKRQGYLITWEEMNEVWMEIGNMLKKNTSLPISLIEAVWDAIASGVPESYENLMIKIKK